MNFKETLAEKTVHAEDVLTKYLPEEKGYQKKVIESYIVPLFRHFGFFQINFVWDFF